MNPYLMYMQSEPVFQQEYDRVRAAGDKRTPEQWMQDHINVSPQDKAKFDAMQIANAGPAVTPADAVNANAGTSAPTEGTGFSSLVTPTQTAQPPFQQAPAPTVGGGNYNQVQNAVQGGQFSTVGQNLGEQNQTSGQTTSGTTTSTPIDTLGFGQLLKDQAASAGANDADRTAFLKDVMQTGGTGFQSQLDQGIRNSLSGPGMQGTGDAARARASGFAASQTGRNNLDQRLGAARELTNPGSLTALSTAANPYIGNSQTTSGSTTGFQDLVSKATESQAGATLGQSSQSGAGQIPQGQPVKTGGCVLCTAGIELRLPGSRLHRVLRRVIRYKLHVDRSTFAPAARGYFAAFTPVARVLLSYPKLARVLFPLARATVYEELRVSGRRLPFRIVPFMVHWTGHAFCSGVGRFFPVSGHVTDAKITDIARRNNILFEVQS